MERQESSPYPPHEPSDSTAVVHLSAFDSYLGNDEVKIEPDDGKDALLLAESFDPIGPKEPESLHSWDWLLSKWDYLRLILNERLREVSHGHDD